MPQQKFDVIVIGTGAGGGMAIRTLCNAGAKVCALNAGRRLNPRKDFRNHRMPYDMKFRGFGDPKLRAQSYGYMDNEYTQGIWEHEIIFTTAPGTKWMWPRCFAVGGKTNFWGRSSARFSQIDFRAASRDGYDIDWPVTYEEIAPYYTRVERMIGVASTVQNRPSNPDGDYLPPMNFRCLDHILQAGARKVGVPYLPDRIAQLTKPLHGHPPCHFCANCTEGCDTGSFFSTPWFFLPDAEKSGNLEMRTNALAKNILVDENGRAAGVAYIDRETKQEIEVYGRAVVVAASCIESAKILLNSKSRHWLAGIANSTGQVGRNLCDHMYGTTGRGYLPQLLGQPSFPDNVSASTIAWLPRWQNLQNPREEKFIRGYSIYPDGGCGGFPGYFDQIEGFGTSFKREIKRRYPTPVSFYLQAPSQRSDSNYVDIDPEVKDHYGIPAVRIHFAWDDNTKQMWEHATHATEELMRAAGAEYKGHGEPEMPGYSLHETGTCRMGKDPKTSVTNGFGQTHDVKNLYVCDASVFPNCTDKTTTLSILAFSLRSSEHLIDMLKA
ncbi:MAG: GMC family oxidoreductase [Acidobacteriaceae bacterium]|nr:GMC family oxidoreductase [Acidobacteriaceae bacterium]MBV9503098.1 GMC family oxidoreductase [Acidobacteriaceae bacterium]